MTVRRPTKKVELGAPRKYLGKAVEYLEVAEGAGSNHPSPAVGNAVHAGILAADAISAHGLGEVWSGDHEGAVDHVKRTPVGKEAARHLHRLLSMKSRAQYDWVNPTPKQVEQALKAARRLVELAGQVLNPSDA